MAYFLKICKFKIAVALMVYKTKAYGYYQITQDISKIIDRSNSIKVHFYALCIICFISQGMGGQSIDVE